MTDWSNQNYQQQLDTKVAWLKELLSPWTDTNPDIYRSPEHSYRMRAEFRIWHEGDETNYAMYEAGTKKTYSIDDFPPADSAIRTLMPKLIGRIRQSEVLRKRLFTSEFLATTTGQVLVSLIYHKPLDDLWVKEAEKLRKELSIDIIGRARKQKIVLGNDYVTEKLSVNETDFQMRQIEGSFTQPNAQVNQKMVIWACSIAERLPLKSDLLELYCGNGNFTLPLSRYFSRVLTTEVSKSSIAALNCNLEANNINNIAMARMSAEEVTEALDGVRPFRRLSHIDLTSYQFSTIFVDPPRAGIDTKTMELVRRFDNIIYVSCNPETLTTNIEQIADTHDIRSTAAFDQFPFTPHLEAGVFLTRK